MIVCVPHGGQRSVQFLCLLLISLAFPQPTLADRLDFNGVLLEVPAPPGHCWSDDEIRNHVAKGLSPPGSIFVNAFYLCDEIENIRSTLLPKEQIDAKSWGFIIIPERMEKYGWRLDKTERMKLFEVWRKMMPATMDYIYDKHSPRAEKEKGIAMTIKEFSSEGVDEYGSYYVTVSSANISYFDSPQFLLGVFSVTWAKGKFFFYYYHQRASADAERQIAEMMAVLKDVVKQTVEANAP